MIAMSYPSQCRAVSYLALFHAMILVLLVVTGWPVWSLLLLIWPAMGYCGARSPDKDLLCMYCTGCAVMATGHVTSALVYVPWRVHPPLVWVCIVYEAAVLCAVSALMRRMRAARHIQAQELPVVPSSSSGIVPA